MPWDLSSVLARVRRPARPQPAPEQPVVQPTPAQQLQIDRRILEDPSSLIDQVQDALPYSLTPSTRWPNPRSRPRTANPPLSELPPVDISVQTPPRIAGGGEWSTFGRKRVPVSGHGRDPNSPHLGADSPSSTYSLSRLTSPQRNAEKQPSPNTRTPDTISSRRHPQTPQRPHSYTAPRATPSVTNITTSVHGGRALDSPHTFGHPTPPDNPVEFSYPSPRPPLPPLDHPELAAVLSARRNSSQPPSSVFRDRSNTLPTNRRTPRKDDLFASLSSKLGRSFHRTSLPDAKQAMAGSEPTGRQRARTVSSSARPRRTSADWSSYQAIHASAAWPAQVSRELLRLSLTRGSDLVQGSPGSRKAPTPATPDRALPRSFLPFPHPHPSRPSSPPLPLQSASATPADGRDVTPARSRSLQFSLGNRRGSELPPASNRMADVKRSHSTVETRNGPKYDASGAAYAVGGITDPGPTTFSKSSQALHPSSALTRPRSLSGRASPMSSSVQGEPSTPTPAPRHLSDKSRGKRKAEDNIDITPPEQKREGQRATFLLPTEGRTQRISNSSHAPSSYHRKRARLSSTSPFTTPAQSRASSVLETPHSGSRNHHFSSLSSSTGARVAPPRTPSRATSRATSTRSRQPNTPSTTRRHERHQSMSQVSIPISAIVSPHAPSISKSAKFHMRDPRKPPKKRNDTPWGLRFASEDEPGSPIQAWCFFLGFLLFPVWWIAGLLLRIPRTRIAGDVEAEKGVTIDDPQIEHDARTWRLRCRVMAVLSLFTYVPFIVLVAVFAPR